MSNPALFRGRAPREGTGVRNPPHDPQFFRYHTPRGPVNATVTGRRIGRIKCMPHTINGDQGNRRKDERLRTALYALGAPMRRLTALAMSRTSPMPSTVAHAKNADAPATITAASEPSFGQKRCVAQ